MNTLGFSFLQGNNRFHKKCALYEDKDSMIDN